MPSLRRGQSDAAAWRSGLCTTIFAGSIEHCADASHGSWACGPHFGFGGVGGIIGEARRLRQQMIEKNNVRRALWRMFGGSLPGFSHSDCLRTLAWVARCSSLTDFRRPMDWSFYFAGVSTVVDRPVELKKKLSRRVIPTAEVWVQSDFITERIRKPSEDYKAQQRVMAQTLIASGLTPEQVARMSLVPVV